MKSVFSCNSLACAVFNVLGRRQTSMVTPSNSCLPVEHFAIENQQIRGCDGHDSGTANFVGHEGAFTEIETAHLETRKSNEIVTFRATRMRGCNHRKIIAVRSKSMAFLTFSIGQTISL